MGLPGGSWWDCVGRPPVAPGQTLCYVVAPGSSRWRGGLRTRHAEAMVECRETSAAAPATRNRSERGERWLRRPLNEMVVMRAPRE